MFLNVNLYQIYFKSVFFKNITYKLFKASDHASQGKIFHFYWWSYSNIKIKFCYVNLKDIKQFFEEAIDFIHNARINNGNVLVHWYTK